MYLQNFSKTLVDWQNFSGKPKGTDPGNILVVLDEQRTLGKQIAWAYMCITLLFLILQLKCSVFLKHYVGTYFMDM